MAGTILLVLTQGFDDMAFLSNQVLLVEAGNDVIISSKTNDAIKGQDSSVMTVALAEAIEQGLDYHGLIIVGGKDIDNWDLLDKTINDFNNKNKIIGAIAEGIEAIKNAGLDAHLSTDDEITVSKNIVSLKNPENVEEFIKEIIAKL